MIVVDASVLVPALADDLAAGKQARARLRGERLAAPELIDLEVQSVLRAAVRAGRLSEQRARTAWLDLRLLPLARARHGPLLARTWELRDNLTSYDASYVALAETLDCILLTTDAQLAHAPRPRCRIELHPAP